MMRKRMLFVNLAMGGLLLLGACSPDAETQEPMMEKGPTQVMMESTPTGEMMAEETPEAMMESTPTGEMMAEETPDAMMEKTGTPDAMMAETGTPDAMPVTGAETPQAEMMAPDWFATEFTDVTSGETFKIEDFKGKVVLVETFAQWCPTCLNQQREVVKLREMLGMPDDLVTVGFDVDPNENAEMLQAYLEKHGFDWHYAIAPAETSREIGDLYGAQFLNPPSAPMLIIDRHGEAHPLAFGLKSAEDLQKALEPFLSDGM